MGRNKRITTQELIRYTDEYLSENPGVKLTIPLLGNFIRCREGENDIRDYLIRRDIEFREYLNKRNESDKETHYKTVATFRNLDIDKFIEQNRTKEKLRFALFQRDSYYSSISISAVAIFAENKKLCDEVNRLQEDIDKCKLELNKKDKKETMAITKENNNLIRKLKGIIDYYVYPEVANMLLQKEGILDIVTEIASPVNHKEHIIDPGTDISKFKHSLVNGLLSNLDEQ
jgi:hypothetical protein